MPNIRKVVIEITVLYEDGDPKPQDLDLAEMVREMDGGEFIGQSRCISDEPVPNEKIEEELFAVGNDGEFFYIRDE